MNQFKRFLEILLHTGQNDAINMIASEYLADILDLSRCHPKSKFIDTFSFGYKNSRDKLIKIERSESSSGARFAMDSEPRGFCVLINNYLTYGTYVEMQRFRNIFYQLHFEVIMKQNLNFDETNRLLDGISKSDQLKEHSAIIFMILSHGTKEKEFLSFDKKGIKIDYLVNKFCNQNCPALLDKPRIYILNCCRGGNYFVIDLCTYFYICFLYSKMRTILVLMLNNIQTLLILQQCSNHLWIILNRVNANLM
jgi:hypothetical protein